MPKNNTELPKRTATLAIIDQEFGTRIFVPGTNHLPRVSLQHGETLERTAEKIGERLVNHRLKLDQVLKIGYKNSDGIIYLFHRNNGHKIDPIDEFNLQADSPGPIPSFRDALESAKEHKDRKRNSMLAHLGIPSVNLSYDYRPAPTGWMSLEDANELFISSKSDRMSTNRKTLSDHFAIKAIRQLNFAEENRKMVTQLSTDPVILQDPSVHLWLASAGDLSKDRQERLDHRTDPIVLQDPSIYP